MAETRSDTLCESEKFTRCYTTSIQQCDRTKARKEILDLGILVRLGLSIINGWDMLEKSAVNLQST